MKKNKVLLWSLLLLPTIVFARENSSEFPWYGALFMEAFVSIHMSIFVLKPLADIFKPEDSKAFFWKLFAIRAVVLLVFDFFVTTYIAMLDFFAVFIGAFIVVPIAAATSKKEINSSFNSNVSNTTNNNAINNQVVVLKCTKCGAAMNVDDKFCPNCGAAFEGDNVSVSTTPRVRAKTTDFDPIYNFAEDQLLEQFIRRKMKVIGMDESTQYDLIPESILKRKKILNIIFAILLFVFVCLIFFHFPIVTYIIGIIILVVFFILSRKYDFMDYLKKEIKSRPGEKITNILMNAKNTMVSDNSKTLQIISIVAAAILPLILFASPRIMYEKVEGGYAVRFYAFGLTNFKTATIPETYKNEKVVSLRGNTFSNMPFLTKVTLPNSIKEIRGQAFKNDAKLISVNIPTNLEYLGGGAFYNCTSIEEVILPDTLTEMGGETFYHASSLKNVRLSENLTEIRGDSCEYCTSLTSIKIPDKVTRIGGHAFYGDTALAEVSISENSQLQEIGSSAFRQCYNLREISLPASTYVNERAFKESPTNVRRFGETVYDYENESEDEGIVDPDSYPEYENLSISSKSFALGDKVIFNKYNIALNYSGLQNGEAMFKLINSGKEESIIIPIKREEIFYYGIGENILSLTNNASNNIYALITKSYSGKRDYKYRFSTTTSVKKIMRFKSGDTPNTGIITVNSVKNENDKTILDLTLSGSINEHVVLSDDKKVYSSDNLEIEMTRTYGDYVTLDVYFK